MCAAVGEVLEDESRRTIIRKHVNDINELAQFNTREFREFYQRVVYKHATHLHIAAARRS